MTRKEFNTRMRAMDGARLVKPDPPGLTVATILHTALAGLAIWACVMGIAWLLLANV